MTTAAEGQGAPVRVKICGVTSAEDALNQAHTEAADMKARAKGLMQAAATCLLGRL